MKMVTDILPMDAMCSGGDDCNDLNVDINPGGTGVFGCPSPSCSTCDINEDCGDGNRCILLDNEMVCAANCSVYGTCPEGYTCSSGQCIPTSGSCKCLPTDDGNERSCSVSNAYGTCIGIQTCDASTGWTICTALTPEVEVCDSLDNDCDSEIDEGFTGLGNLCTVGIGACLRQGSIVCSNDGTGTECNAVPGMPSLELCDGIDNDCNGLTDDNLIAPLCEKQQGVCMGSRKTTCDGASGWPVCVVTDYGPNYEEVETSCDGLDNDCDGEVDEGACAIGWECTSNIQCTSGFCTDGYCCNTACTGSCQSCGLPGMVGMCAYYPSGSDPENECTDASTCDGLGGCM